MKSQKPFVAVILLGLITGCAAPVSPPTPQITPSGNDLTLAESFGISDAQWGYLVIDAESGDIVTQENADISFPPASTAKLPTAIAALNILKPTYRFSTQLLAQGKLQSGVLTGELTLSGNGDPLMSVGDIRALATRLKDIGVRKVDGRFLYHSVLPTFTEVERTQPASAPYNQGISGLNLEFNRAIKTRQSSGTYVTPNEADDLIAAKELGTGWESSVPVQKPDTLTARVFARFARIEGIDLPVPQRGIPAPNSVILAEIRSQPLIEIARAGLEYSNNMVAEVMGLAASRALGGSATTLQSSADQLGVWMERNIPGLDSFATALSNHSGLSTQSRVTPRQMTTILLHAMKHRFDGWRIDSLMRPGGTRDALRSRFRDPDTAYRVWAKSGTMRYIKGIVGYLDAHSGRRLIFALYVYDPKRRAELEVDPERYGVAARQTSTAWRRASDAFEAALIRRWITTH